MCKILYPTVEAVVEYNINTGANAAKASPDDASGLEAVVCLAKSARVMLTSNLWVETGLEQWVPFATEVEAHLTYL